jgi:hypothetical protein
MFFISAFFTGNIHAARVKFFVVSQSKSELVDAKTICFVFETLLFNDLKEAFPCVDYLDQHSLHALLGWERKKALLGSGDDSQLQNLAGAVGSDYLVKFTANVVGNQMYLSAFCMDMRKAENLARSEASGTIGEASSNAKKVSKDLIKQLKEYEICPYSGPVTIEVKSELDDSKIDKVNCLCGGDVAIVTTTRKTNSTMKWELNKINKNACSGTAKYDLNEKMTIESNYPCFKCDNGDQGFTKITETDESEAKVEGLSNESVSDGKQVDDARIMLYFLEDGTYNVLVKATSKKGVLKKTTEKKYEGACENESEPKDTQSKSIDIPFVVVFGPYQGTAHDKVLSQKESKDASNGSEKVTISIDFTLTQKF